MVMDSLGWVGPEPSLCWDVRWLPLDPFYHIWDRLSPIPDGPVQYPGAAVDGPAFVTPRPADQPGAGLQPSFFVRRLIVRQTAVCFRGKSLIAVDKLSTVAVTVPRATATLPACLQEKLDNP